MDPQLGEVLQQLIQSDLRFEVLIRSIVDTLADKKQADGTPLITREEISARAEVIKNEFIEKSKIARPPAHPPIILPSGASGPT